VGGFDYREIAGKTGTPQNWSDAWAIGFSPQFTTAVWFGFDTPGNSLGVNLTGATAAGPIWARFMKTIHEGLPKEELPVPLDGIVRVNICAESGLLPDPNGQCEDTYEEVFLKGPEPTEFCTRHKKKQEARQEIVQNLRNTMVGIDLEVQGAPFPEVSDFVKIEELLGVSPAAETGNPLLE
jgi:penicillin-binding protein 1A